jgi:hypothetical protein
MKIEQSVPKRRHTKFRRRGITQKKANNIGEDKCANGITNLKKNSGIPGLG